MEQFSIPGVSGIIERCIDGVDHILIQERFKEDAPAENGLIEIPAGKIRRYEKSFDCLRREIQEETGLRVVEIQGEQDALVSVMNGYRVINYTPFNSSQNLEGYYPIMVQTFLCTAEGELLTSSNETQNLRWIPLQELSTLLEADEGSFYPMHLVALKKYLRTKGRWH
ncbi:MAG TPA: NUDIX domain-containing protein [Symbiobacteriaceae bacterium]|nr:NUDIX domain-containing protein [Symbiobacteriaceae bacterium]